MLYLLFGVVLFGAALRGDPEGKRFVFTAFAVFGVMGPGIFGFGMVVAIEREQGLLKLKRALPMPPAAYLTAKMFMAILFAVIVMVTMIAAAPLLGHLTLTISQVMTVAVINILGALPFCAIGLFIGTRTTSRSAPAFVNIIYQLMMHISGLFYPLPKFLRTIAPVWPTYHLQQLVLSSIGPSSDGATVLHTVVLGSVTMFLTVLALRRLMRTG
jgi:ABC-2 type transport system permease protein